jgi:nucleotide-binding universal stress UspA family protein
VHVVTPTLAVGPTGVAPDIAVRQAGREVLAHGEALVHRIAPHVDVTTTLMIGTRPDAITERSHDAELVVVGAPPHDLMGRLWTGSTVTGVAARSACPVAVIPAGESKDDAHQVSVGLKSTDNVDQLLAAAFSVAGQTGAELRIVHAWKLLTPYENAVAERLPTPEWEIEEERRIEGLLIDLRLAYPTVSVRVDLVHGQPAYVLVEASEDADVIVISRPIHGGFVHHLGATARAVIREAHCPVLIVPPDESGVVGHHARAAAAVAP